MLIVDEVVHLSASDLVGHLNCSYLTNLDLAVAKGSWISRLSGIQFWKFWRSEALCMS